MAESRMLKDPLSTTTSMELVARVPFPQNEHEFHDDPRIDYSKERQSWILNESDGQSWEFNARYNKWGPMVDAVLFGQSQQDDSEHDPSSEIMLQHLKRRTSAGDDEQDGAPRGKTKKAKPAPKEPVVRTNTAIYVSSIPLDASEDEVHDVFKNFGIIQEELYTDKSRVKLYYDDEGNFKGDALIVYLKPESVQLAITMMDDSDFRFGQPNPAGKMRVVQADASYKKSGPDAPGQQKDTKPTGAKPGKKTSKDADLIIKKTKKMESKLADWDDEDPSVIDLPEEPKERKHERRVVLKHMFSAQDLEEETDEDGELIKREVIIKEIEDDVAEECNKIGRVSHVNLWDLEPDGTVTVLFEDHEDAKACVERMNGRNFANQVITAYLANGKEWFKASKRTKHASKPTGAAQDLEDKKRLANFGKYLEGGEVGAEANGRN